jgi:thiamine-phosphate pyrophosphorylase
MAQRAGAISAAMPRFILVTPPLDDAAAFAPTLAAACAAADVAAVILRTAAGDDAATLRRVAAIAPSVREKGPLLLLSGLVHLISPANADGAHIGGASAVAIARESVRDDVVIGAGRLESRHDAMIAGENGADYVMFGEPGGNGKRPTLAGLTERVLWWAELFQLPCVAYAGHLDEIDPLIRAGADFIALGEEVVWKAPDGPAMALAAATVHLAVAEPAR